MGRKSTGFTNIFIGVLLDKESVSSWHFKSRGSDGRQPVLDGETASKKGTDVRSSQSHGMLLLCLYGVQILGRNVKLDIERWKGVGEVAKEIFCISKRLCFKELGLLEYAFFRQSYLLHQSIVWLCMNYCKDPP